MESHREKGERKGEEKPRQGSRDLGCQPAAPGSFPLWRRRHVSVCWKVGQTPKELLGQQVNVHFPVEFQDLACSRSKKYTRHKTRGREIAGDLGCQVWRGDMKKSISKRLLQRDIGGLFTSTFQVSFGTMMERPGGFAFTDSSGCQWKLLISQEIKRRKEIKKERKAKKEVERARWRKIFLKIKQKKKKRKNKREMEQNER